MTNKIKLQDEKIGEFKKDYLNNTRNYCADKYNVSIDVIDKWAKEFSLFKDLRWTKEETELLKKTYSSLNYSRIEIDDLFPMRTHNSIRGKVKELGLYRPTNEEILPKRLTNHQEEILNGIILGDASIYKKKKKYNNAYIKFSQQYLNKEYVDYIYNILFPFSNIKPKKEEKPGLKYVNKKIIKDNSKTLKSYLFYTRSHSIFTKLENKWYLRDENGNYVLKEVGEKGRKVKIKTIPRDLKLTEKTLSYWYFDDGSLSKKNRVIILCTEGFIKKDNEFLVEILKRDLNFSNPIINHKNEISFYGRDFTKFINILKNYDIFECFRNKKMDIYNIKLSWRDTKNGNPRSPLDDKLAKKIIKLAKRKIPQVEIAKKLKISNSLVAKLLQNKTHYKVDYDNSLNYRNKSGYNGVSYLKKQNKFQSSMQINYKQIYLGAYDKKSDAISIMKMAERMLRDGIVDPEKYIFLKNSFKKILCK